MKKLLFAIIGLVMLASCNSQKNTTITNIKNDNKMSKIYELAINQSKEGQYETFLSSRKAFVDVLGQEENTLNEGKWQPFFTLTPDMNLGRVLIGMTEWNSIQGFGESATKLMPQKEAQEYFESFNPLAYALLEPVDGKEFDFESIKKEGNTIEFAIRKGKTDDAFGATRDVFFKSLENYDGYKFAREFKVTKLDENGQPNFAENTQAVIIVWENGETFQAAATSIFASSEFADFSKLIDVETYFASTTIK